ncbi:vascular endothelial growth factor C-like [Scylla paramamosain]|uniref:vascular endothelial growth factor C-like n=1 Tax=Scylla paramamosain TaxID=85552 RepID=UPI00308363EF
MKGAQWLAMSLTLALAAGEGYSQARTKRNTPIFFPGSFAPEPHTTALELPENMDLNTLDLESLSRINTIGNITAFADLFGIPLPDGSFTDELSTRFGASSEEAIMANCKPEMRTVHLDLPVEANTLFFPTCVRLEQCGGCCYGPLLTCRPTRTTPILLKVLKTKLNDSSRSGGRRSRTRRRRETVPSYHEVEVQKHEECACGCKVQEDDCKPNLHTYFEGECACVCNNKDDKAKCEQQGETKYWDNETCNCYCRRPVPCSTGQFFSPVSCKCE